MDCNMPDFLVHHQCIKPAQTHNHRVSDAAKHLLFCLCPLLQPLIFFSIMLFPNGSVLHFRCSKYSRSRFSTSSSNHHCEQISLIINPFHLLKVQGTLKSFLQHHISITLILWRSRFFRSNFHLYVA